MSVRASKSDINVGILIIQPTKNSIEEIANVKLKVPNRTRSRIKQVKTNTKVSKPKLEVAKKPTTRRPRAKKEKGEIVVDK